jgi:hypothetical protein
VFSFVSPDPMAIRANQLALCYLGGDLFPGVASYHMGDIGLLVTKMIEVHDARLETVTTVGAWSALGLV